VDIEPVLLAVLAELGGEARPNEVYPHITAKFPELTREDLEETLADGRMNKWFNRVQWARQRLADEGAIDRSTRGVWRLSAAGWHRAKADLELPPHVPSLVQSQTPREQLDSAWQTLREELGRDILAAIIWSTYARASLVKLEVRPARSADRRLSLGRAHDGAPRRGER
jgi:hypothetical protein